MRIEVVANSDATPKEKGDQLENLTSNLLRAQSFDVKQRVRVTACELDLLCEHRLSGKTLYVECKTHRENLSVNALTNLFGTITLKGYNEGWLISAGPLGKDATGFLVEWEQRPRQERSKLSIYTPERLVGALQDARLVSIPPLDEALSFLSSEDRIGEWSLLVTPWGNFWACLCLESGVPVGVALFDSKSGKRLADTDLLGRISRSDTTLANLRFDYEPTNVGAPCFLSRVQIPLGSNCFLG